MTVTGANIPDGTPLVPLVDAIPEWATGPGDPAPRPGEAYTARAYDSEPHRDPLRARDIDPKIPEPRTKHGSGFGAYRWVVERTNSWLHPFAKLRRRTDPDGAVHKALVALSSALVRLRFL